LPSEMDVLVGRTHPTKEATLLSRLEGKREGRQTVGGNMHHLLGTELM
jgi:hypothetical protein